MSTVVIQVGQAGNQVGCELFSALASGCQDPETMDKFFHRKRSRSKGSTIEARAVMVDLESKVVGSTLEKARRGGIWAYPTGRQFCQKRGAGNNWANGYANYGGAACEAVLALVQKEVERCAELSGFLVLLSVAGGTGSGFGTRLTEALRATYPHSIILNYMIWPYSTGEVIVQNYNATLSLSRLYQCSDGLFLILNDEVQRVCQDMLKLKTVTFDQMNQVIARCLASVLRPALEEGEGLIGSAADLVRAVCPHPDYKLLSVRAVPQMPETYQEYTVYKWPLILKTVKQMAITSWPCEEGINWRVKVPTAKRASPGFFPAVANLLVLHGTDARDADTSAFEEAGMYARWSPTPFTAWRNPSPMAGHDKSAGIISNTKGSVVPVEAVVSRAWEMFSSRAFVHQYTKYGVEEAEFLDGFVKGEQIVKSYSSL